MNGLVGVLDTMQDTSKVLLGFLFAWLIFYIQQRYSEKKEKKDIVNAFYTEIKRNALTCEIAISDETKITYFDMDSWSKIKTGNYIPLHRDIISYIFQIENINRLINDFRSYEKDYTAGVAGQPKFIKTDEDRRLEAKRDRVKNALKELKDTIKTARDRLKQQIAEIK